MIRDKAEVLSAFLKQAIENDFTDLVELALSYEDFGKKAITDPDWLCLAANNKSPKTLSLLVDKEFNSSHHELTHNTLRSIKHDLSNIDTYKKVLDYIGRERISQQMLSYLTLEAQNRRGSKVNPISNIFTSGGDHELFELIYPLIFSYFDITLLTPQNAIDCFQYMSVLDDPNAEIFLRDLHKNNVLSDMTKEERERFLLHIGKSKNTNLLTFCLSKNIISLASFFESFENDEYNMPSFSVFVELNKSGVDTSDLEAGYFKDHSGIREVERYIMHLNQELEKGVDVASYHGFNLLIDMAKNDWLEIHDSESRFNQNNMISLIVNSAKSSADLIVLFINKLDTICSQCGLNKLYPSLITSIVKKGFDAKNKEILTDLLSIRPSYINFLKGLLKESEQENSHGYFYNAFDYYLFFAAYDGDFRASTKLMESAPLNEKAVDSILKSLKDEKRVFGAKLKEIILPMILPFLSEDSKALIHRRNTCQVEDGGFSISRELTSYAKSNTQETQCNKLLTVATADKEDVAKFFNNCNKSKNSDNKIRLVLSLHNMEVLDAMMIEGINDSGKRNLMNALTSM